MSICPIRIFSHARFARFRYCCQGAAGRASARARSSKSRGAPFPFYLQTWCRSVIHLPNVSRFPLHIWNQFIFLPTVYLDRQNLFVSCEGQQHEAKIEGAARGQRGQRGEGGGAGLSHSWVVQGNFRWNRSLPWNILELSDLNSFFLDFKLGSVSDATNKTAGGLLQGSLQSSYWIHFLHNLRWREAHLVSFKLNQIESDWIRLNWVQPIKHHLAGFFWVELVFAVSLGAGKDSKTTNGIDVNKAGWSREDLGEDRIVLTVDLLFPIEQTISTFNMLGRRGGVVRTAASSWWACSCAPSMLYIIPCHYIMAFEVQVQSDSFGFNALIYLDIIKKLLGPSWTNALTLFGRMCWTSCKVGAPVSVAQAEAKMNSIWHTTWHNMTQYTWKSKDSSIVTLCFNDFQCTLESKVVWQSKMLNSPWRRPIPKRTWRRSCSKALRYQ